MQTVPYFNFNQSLEAFEFYKKLGANNFDISLASDPAFDDMPAEQKPENPEKFVMNASFEILGNKVYISDTWDQSVKVDHEHSNLCFEFDMKNPEEVQTDKDFVKLAEENGCDIVMPLEETEWTRMFCLLKDPFGLTWMFNGIA